MFRTSSGRSAVIKKTAFDVFLFFAFSARKKNKKASERRLHKTFIFPFESGDESSFASPLQLPRAPLFVLIFHIIFLTPSKAEGRINEMVFVRPAGVFMLRKISVLRHPLTEFKRKSGGMNGEHVCRMLHVEVSKADDDDVA